MNQPYFAHLLECFIWTVLVSYAVFTAGLFLFWKKIRKPAAGTDTSGISISVIVPVRNEAENIGALLSDLASQNLPKNQYEILIMDDGSTDATAAIVKAFASRSRANIRLIPLPAEATSSPKKRAIETAISHATGDLIVTTDGDCRVGAEWLSGIAACKNATKARLISGPVTFTDERFITDYLQTVEFASLVGSGACSMEAGFPSMCNGANLAYEKKTFFEVNGFDGVRHIASGDDEFLMHKVAAAFPGEVTFLKSADAVVRTQPHHAWGAFFRQRKRWASKWKHYKSRTPLVLAMYIFTCNFSLLAGMAMFASGSIPATSFLAFLGLKCLPEWLFLGSVLLFLKKPKSLFYIPLTQIMYPFYVCFFGLAAQNPRYEWKGRKLV